MQRASPFAPILVAMLAKNVSRLIEIAQCRYQPESHVGIKLLPGQQFAQLRGCPFEPRATENQLARQVALEMEWEQRRC